MSSHDHLTHDHGHEGGNAGGGQHLRRGQWVFIAFVAIAAIFLISEHRAHVLGALPFVLLLACPLLHMFMHGGHGGHGGHSHGGDAGAPQDRSKDGKDWT